MSVVTRSKTAARLRDIVHHLPDCLWIEILGSLPGSDISRVSAVNKHFRRLAPDVWREACAKRWPEWFALSAAPAGSHWRRHYEMFNLRQNDLEVQTGSPPTINKLQTVVTAAHRTVLAEWLTEVSHTWELDSTVLFKAIGYLDHYLSKHDVLQLRRFQLYGLACLRAVMQEVNQRHQSVDSPSLAKELDSQRFAHISDKTYSAEEVERATEDVQQAIPADLRQCPTAKIFLRSFWYRLAAARQIDSSKMHVYTLASFFLQLSLLDLSCTGFPACALAAAALSVALQFFNENAWPKLLQHYTALTPEELQPIKTAICRAQATQSVENFRLIWRSQEGEPGQNMYVEHTSQWQQIIKLMSAKSEVKLGD